MSGSENHPDLCTYCNRVATEVNSLGELVCGLHARMDNDYPPDERIQGGDRPDEDFEYEEVDE